jgi:hypothetical protein
MKATGGVGQHWEDGRVVGEKRVHEALSDGDRRDQEKAKQTVLHVVGRGQRDSTAYFIEKNKR